jgi:hypothetical protein
MNRVNLPAVWRIAWNTLPGEYILFPVVRARSNRVHFRSVLPKLRQNALFSVAQLVA